MNWAGLIELDWELFFGRSCFGDVVGLDKSVDQPFFFTCNWIYELAHLLLWATTVWFTTWIDWLRYKFWLNGIKSFEAQHKVCMTIYVLTQVASYSRLARKNPVSDEVLLFLIRFSAQKPVFWISSNLRYYTIRKNPGSFKSWINQGFLVETGFFLRKSTLR